MRKAKLRMSGEPVSTRRNWKVIRSLQRRITHLKASWARLRIATRKFFRNEEHFDIEKFQLRVELRIKNYEEEETN